MSLLIDTVALLQQQINKVNGESKAGLNAEKLDLLQKESKMITDLTGKSVDVLRYVLTANIQDAEHGSGTVNPDLYRLDKDDFED